MKFIFFANDGMNGRELWKTNGMASSKTAPENATQVSLSGTKVREMLGNGERPPAEFSRAEVADILIDWATKKAPVTA